MRFIHRHEFSFPIVTTGNVLGAAKFGHQVRVATAYRALYMGCKPKQSRDNFRRARQRFLARSLIHEGLVARAD
jgi:hypothetical protein